MTPEILPIFIGYDDREDAAYRTCVASLERHSSKALRIEPLKHKHLREIGLFSREWLLDAKGQYHDVLDGKPFSTQFSHSRFLVPHYADYLGIHHGWALFIDCDFLFLSDVAQLFDLADENFALMCVKHVHEPPDALKMDNVKQTRYKRKNWSSCMLWNLDHPQRRFLGLDQVNNCDGGWLHALSWLQDSAIGGLPESWNWLEGHSSLEIKPNAVHMTRGGPWLDGWNGVAFAWEWHLASLDSIARQLRDASSALQTLDRIT